MLNAFSDVRFHFFIESKYYHVMFYLFNKIMPSTTKPFFVMYGKLIKLVALHPENILNFQQIMRIISIRHDSTLILVRDYN